MDKYYRIRHGANTSGYRQYVAISKNPVFNLDDVEDEYPYGNMTVNAVPTEYVVNPDNTTRSGQLFDEHPGKVHVTGAFFDDRIRHAFPTMAALIKNDYPGKTIVASSDLSKHSSSIAKKFAKMGVIEPSENNPDFVQTNTHDFENLSSYDPDFVEDLYGSSAKKVNERDILGAKDTLRGILKSNRNIKRPRSSEKLSPQFEQLKLPGID